MKAVSYYWLTSKKTDKSLDIFYINCNYATILPAYRCLKLYTYPTLLHLTSSVQVNVLQRDSSSVVFANFHNVNIPIKANVKLPTLNIGLGRDAIMISLYVRPHS